MVTMVNITCETSTSEHCEYVSMLTLAFSTTVPKHSLTEPLAQL